MRAKWLATGKQTENLKCIQKCTHMDSVYTSPWPIFNFINVIIVNHCLSSTKSPHKHGHLVLWHQLWICKKMTLWVLPILPRCPKVNIKLVIFLWQEIPDLHNPYNYTVLYCMMGMVFLDPKIVLHALLVSDTPANDYKDCGYTHNNHAHRCSHKSSTNLN